MSAASSAAPDDESDATSWPASGTSSAPWVEEIPTVPTS